MASAIKIRPAETRTAGYAYGFYLSSTDAARLATSLAYSDAEAAARKARRGLWPVWLGEK